ncbi:hypothetical protein [Herbaspirillum rubrisubalbicans]|uniref:hypothetical protein n=1 Tax=Herbaspirillum rubrisubalbicans TaxID=80842 RepID=UPI001C12E77B|nr:hypothetical protein [Herbaspirillum rubrisubalbicans]
MPTIRHYFKKSVSNVLLLAAAVVAAFCVALFLAWVLPSNGPHLRIFFWYFYAKEIGIGIAVFTAAFFLSKAYKVYRTEKSFARELLKMSPSIIIWVAFFLFSSTYLFNFFHQTDCERYNYTEKLHGGVKEIAGATYHISICGAGVSGSHFFGEGTERVRLTITDEQGGILAKRYYKIFLDDSSGLQSLSINKNRILYFDADSKQEDISIPPSIHDWIGARIPILN